MSRNYCNSATVVAVGQTNPAMSKNVDEFVNKEYRKKLAELKIDRVMAKNNQPTTFDFIDDSDNVYCITSGKDNETTYHIIALLNQEVRIKNVA